MLFPKAVSKAAPALGPPACLLANTHQKMADVPERVATACEHCGTVPESVFSTGRFCSLGCRNGFSVKEGQRKKKAALEARGGLPLEARGGWDKNPPTGEAIGDGGRPQRARPKSYNESSLAAERRPVYLDYKGDAGQDPVRSEGDSAFPCASAAILPKTDAFACGAAADHDRRGVPSQAGRTGW